MANANSTTINTPLSADLDLFQVAEACVKFVIELGECDNIAGKLAWCGRLSHALTQLRGLCDVDLPPHLIEKLTAEKLPASCVPDYWSETYMLVDYAQALAQTLLSSTQTAEVTGQLTGLLHDLIHLMASYIKEPRFIK